MWLTIYDIRLVTLGDQGIQLLRQLKGTLCAFHKKGVKWLVYLPLGPWGRVIGLPLRSWVLLSLEQGDARSTEAVTQGRRGQVPRRGRRAHPPDHLHPNILSLLSALSSHGAPHTQHAVRAIPFAQQVP